MPQPRARAALDLFLSSFLILFLELACIRWFASTVVFLTFFTNIVLLAAFLGMSVGCLAAADRRDLVESVTVRPGDEPGRVEVDIKGRLNALLGEEALPNRRQRWGGGGMDLRSSARVWTSLYFATISQPAES